jgi:hypothetical protein
MRTLWRKNQENPSDRISHAWAPLRSPGIDSKELILTAYVACRAGGRTLFIRFLASIDFSKITALNFSLVLTHCWNVV